MLFNISLGRGFETGFLRVTVLVVLELALVDQADLELTEICLPLPPERLEKIPLLCWALWGP